MNDVMDRLERADIEYLAMRLPRDRPGRGGGDEHGPVEDGQVARNGHGVAGGKVKVKEEPDGMPNGKDGNDDDTEELLDSYEMPCTLVPLS
jgi:hypothetical protein